MPRADQIRVAGTSGFTLVEVLVALVVAGLGLSLLMEAASSGIESTTAADRYIYASSMAQSHLALVGHTLPLRKGDYFGDDGDGYRWRVKIAEPLVQAGSGAKPVIGLYRITVIESWRNGASQKSMSLYSERSGSP
jgi:general secretion pathway protein I